MVVLDTTFLIHFLRNKKSAVEKAKKLKEASTTRINIFEVLVGIYNKKTEKQDNELVVFYNFIEALKILELDAKSADTAARISAGLRQKGETVTETDILIAAIALTNGEEEILTQNTKDFSKIPDIRIEKY